MKRLEIEEIINWLIKNHFPNTMDSCMTDTVCLFIEMVERLVKEKEWLIHEYAKHLSDQCFSVEDIKFILRTKLMKALEEK